MKTSSEVTSTCPRSERPNKYLTNLNVEGRADGFRRVTVGLALIAPAFWSPNLSKEAKKRGICRAGLTPCDRLPSC